MSVTMQRVNQSSTRERRWNEFLAALTPWALHALTKGDQELILHDEYVSGNMTLKDVRLILSFDGIATEEPTNA